MNPPEDVEMEKKSNNQLAEEQPLEEKATERLSHGEHSHQSDMGLVTGTRSPSLQATSHRLLEVFGRFVMLFSTPKGNVTIACSSSFQRRARS